MTIKEISQKSGLSLELLQFVYDTWGKKNAEYIFHSGWRYMTKEHFEAYCYLWRNVCYRYSSELIEYQL